MDIVHVVPVTAHQQDIGRASSAIRGVRGSSLPYMVPQIFHVSLFFFTFHNRRLLRSKKTVQVQIQWLIY